MTKAYSGPLTKGSGVPSGRRSLEQLRIYPMTPLRGHVNPHGHSRWSVKAAGIGAGHSLLIKSDLVHEHGRHRSHMWLFLIQTEMRIEIS